MESRHESRKPINLVVSLKGRDSMGELFSQGAIASSVSTGGALLSGITRQIRPQDVVWVEYSGRKARFKIVWVRNSESQQLTQAAVQLFSGQDCPWKDEITVS